MQNHTHHTSKKRKNNLCLVIGNGPSAKLVHYNYLRRNHIDFIGMNSAFRHWDITGIYPTYYISVDTVVTKSNIKDIIRLINKSSIKKFFLSKVFSDIHPEYENHKKVIIIDKVVGDKKYKFLSDEGPRTTGAWGLRVAAEMEYHKVSLIGFDGIREEFLKEAERVNGDNSLELRLKSNPKFNPNYFFSGYQQKGDSYQVPNVEGYTKANGIKLHTDALQKAISALVNSNINVYYHSHDDYSGVFAKSSTLGLINEDKTPLKNENEVCFSVENTISEVKNQYEYILNTDINILSVDSFYIGKPINSKKQCIIDPDINLHSTLNGQKATYFIKNTFFEKDKIEKTEFNLFNAMRWGAIIEWEIECENGIIEYISNLDIKEELRQKLLNYKNNIFINLSADDVNFWHTFKLCLKDYNFERHFVNKNDTGSRRQINQSLNINSGGESNLSDNLLLCDGSKINQKFLLLYHGLVDVNYLRIALNIVSETDEVLEFSVAPNRTTPTTREENLKPRIYKLHKNKSSIIEFRNNYQHTHNVTRIMLNNSTNTNFQAHIKSAALTVIDKSGTVHLKTWLAESNSLIASKSIQEQQSNTIMFIESDMIDMQGHYYRYVCNLLGHKVLGNWRKILIAREDMNVSLGNIECAEIHKVYNRNTWTIQTNGDNFYKRTVKALESIKNINRSYIYMYTGSIFHAIQLAKIINEIRFQQIHVTCNLFWEMIKDTSTDRYLEGFRLLGDLMKISCGRLKLTAPTSYVKELLFKHTGEVIDIAPHPATGFDDDLFLQRVKSYNNSESQRDSRLILFPGVNTQDKGYNYGIEIAKKLSKKGYKCMVRPSEGVEINSALEYLELGVSEQEFDQVLKQAALIVLPYMPSGFKSRTSGLVVDALYNGANCCVIENTWLEEFVLSTDCGISICENNSINAANKIVSYIASIKNRTINITGMTDYFKQNSWECLIKQVTRK